MTQANFMTVRVGGQENASTPSTPSMMHTHPMYMTQLIILLPIYTDVRADRISI